MSHYAAVAADTFSSELGILAKTQPFLITDLVGIVSLRPRRVPPGTNGGVTAAGLAAGMGGSAIMAVVAVLLPPFCKEWTFVEKLYLVFDITILGLCGSMVDSIMGGLLQASVVDTKSGKVVEGEGGEKVLYVTANKLGEAGRKVLVGRDLLSNNGVNFLMATTMSVVPLLVLWIVL